jgi:hypothetical protein
MLYFIMLSVSQIIQQQDYHKSCHLTGGLRKTIANLSLGQDLNHKPPTTQGLVVIATNTYINLARITAISLSEMTNIFLVNSQHL